MRLQSSCAGGLHSSQGLPGAGGSASAEARTHGWQAGPGCRQEASVPTQVDLSVGLFKGCHIWQLDSPK